MKQAAAFFLIVLFSFNLVGYRFLFDCMQTYAASQTAALVDSRDYDDAQLKEIKVPINMPYQSNWSSYERFSGQVKIDGHVYQYVKRKVANDTLYLLCIPDVKSQKVEMARVEFFKMTNDLDPFGHANSDKSAGHAHKNFQSDYDDYSFSIHLLTTPLGCNIYPVLSAESPNTFNTRSPEQPPDLQYA